MALTCGEIRAREVLKAKFDRTLTIGRTAILTAPLQGRPACHYCGPCSRGCSTGSYYSSPHSSLPAAFATGRLTLDLRRRGEPRRDSATTAAAAASPTSIASPAPTARSPAGWSCCAPPPSRRRASCSTPDPHATRTESPTRAACSATTSWTTSWAAAPAGALPMLKGVPDERAQRPNGIYVPRFQNLEDKHPDFLRGYGFQGGASLVKWGHAFAPARLRGRRSSST